MARYPRSIAITGTHGKTTTTGMTAMVLDAGGLDPTVLIGGDLPAYGGNARLGASDVFLAEACEAYDSFLDLDPSIAVVTNIEADHLDYYGDLDNVLRSFRKFLSQVSGTAIVCAPTTPMSARLIAVRLDRPARSSRSASTATSRLRAADCVAGRPASVLHGPLEGEPLGRITLSVPGVHNVANSLAAVAVGLELGVPFPAIAAGLEAFTGTGRRFERLGETPDGVLVIDDYAHHPTEIRATLAAARGAYPGPPHRRRLPAAPALPHARLRRQFAESFGDADLVVLTDIFLAREQPLEGVTGAGLAALTADRRGAEHVTYVADKAQLPARLAELVRPGDLVLTLGAGDIRAGRGRVPGPRAMRRAGGRGMTKLKVAVLMGGTSAEREVSLSTGRQILNALDPDKYTVYALDTASAGVLPPGVTPPSHAPPPTARPRSRPCPTAQVAPTSGPMSSSSPCTARAARTAPSRGCWKCLASPTPAAASWRAPWRWTRPCASAS